MPKSSTTPTTTTTRIARSPLSPRTVPQPSNSPDELTKQAAEVLRSTTGTLKAPKLSAPPTRLAVSATNVNDPAYWSISGDFLRSGVNVYNKSGKHVISDPLNGPPGKTPKWLQIQFNVLIKDESDWTCELMMKDLGGMMCARDLVVAVQTGGKSTDPIKKIFTLHLVPPAAKDPQDDPRIAISYFMEYTEKRYIQAMDGTLPYKFVLTRVSGVGGAENGRKKHWWRK